MDCMKHLEKLKKIVLGIAIGMCVLSFTLSELMYIKAAVHANKLAIAIGGSGSLTLLEETIGRLTLYTNPTMASFMILSLFVYMWPAIGLLILWRWFFLQLTVLVATTFLLRYDINSIHGNYATLVNGCNACETHGLFHFLSAGAILVCSCILHIIASFVEIYFRKDNPR